MIIYKGETAIDREVARQQYEVAVSKFKHREKKERIKQLKEQLRAKKRLIRMKKKTKKHGWKKAYMEVQKAIQGKKRKLKKIKTTVQIRKLKERLVELQKRKLVQQRASAFEKVQFTSSFFNNQKNKGGIL